MANTKISQLTANTNPSGSEEMVYALNNANGKMTLNTMKTFVQNNLTGYVTTADLATGLATKQDTLVSGTNIRTINGASVMGSGDIIVTGGTGYTAGPGINISGGVISATGGGGSSVDLIAGYNASAGDTVMLNASGQFEQVSGVRTLSLNTGTDTLDNNSLIKSIKVGDNKILYVGSVGGYLTLYMCDDQLSQQKVTTTYRGYYFNVCSTMEGYAIVTYRDRDNSNKAYCFAVDCTGATPTYGTSVAISSDTTKGSANLASVKVQDADSTIFCGMYVLNTDSKCYYNLCSFDTSTLAVTTGTETSFNGNINTLNNSPFAYLGNGLIGYAYSYVDLIDTDITHLVLAVRGYNNGALGNMGTFDLGDNISITGTDCQIVPNGTGGIISMDEHVWVYSFEDYFAGNTSSDYNSFAITTMITDGYHGSRKTYKTVDDGQYLLGAYLTPTSIILNKYIVSRAGMHKVRGREIETTGASLYNHLNLEEIRDNSGITNPADGEYRLVGLNSSKNPIVIDTKCRGGKFIGVVNTNTSSGVMGTVLIGGTVPGTFTSAGNKVFVGNGVLTDTPTDYFVGFSISTTQAVLINGVK